MRIKFSAMDRIRVLHKFLPKYDCEPNIATLGEGSDIEANLDRHNAGFKFILRRGVFTIAVFEEDVISICSAKNLEGFPGLSEIEQEKTAAAYRYIAFLAPINVRVYRNIVNIAVKSKLGGQISVHKTPHSLRLSGIVKPTKKEIDAWRKTERERIGKLYLNNLGATACDSDGRPA